MVGKDMRLPIDVKQEVLDAEERIRPHIVETPLDYSPYLSSLADCDVYLKLETVQTTGSFKYRGAVNSILALSPEERERGVVTSSTGNHGAAFVVAAQRLGCKCTLYLPENVSDAKLELIKLYGATDIKFHGTDTFYTEARALQEAEELGSTFVSPYNHVHVIGGQGTIAIELCRQLERMDAVIMPVGGGGLAAGVAGYLKETDPDIQIIGGQPLNSPVMVESIKAGKLIQMESKPTLSEGTWGGIETGAITFPLCQAYIDDYEVISEEQLEQAIILALEKDYMLIEGAAALSIATLISRKEQFKNKTVVLVLTGKKISYRTLKAIISK